jgi:hypothetical protein
VNAESEGSVEEPGKEAGSVQQEARTCLVCGTKFFATPPQRRMRGYRCFFRDYLAKNYTSLL